MGEEETTENGYRAVHRRQARSFADCQHRKNYSVDTSGWSGGDLIENNVVVGQLIKKLTEMSWGSIIEKCMIENFRVKLFLRIM